MRTVKCNQFGLQVEEGVVGDDGFIHTASPPWAGVQLEGTYMFGLGEDLGTVDGEVSTLYPLGVNDEGTSFAVLSKLAGGAASASPHL